METVLHNIKISALDALGYLTSTSCVVTTNAREETRFNAGQKRPSICNRTLLTSAQRCTWGQPRLQSHIWKLCWHLITTCPNVQRHLQKSVFNRIILTVPFAFAEGGPDGTNPLEGPLSSVIFAWWNGTWRNQQLLSTENIRRCSLPHTSSARLKPHKSLSSFPAL